MIVQCFECDKPATERHHVVPRSRGGKRTVWLCSTCHGVVHNVHRNDIQALTSDGLERARKRGVILGRPVKLQSDVMLRIVTARSKGQTLQAIADALTMDGVPTAQGGQRWYPSTIRTILDRHDRISHD